LHPSLFHIHISFLQFAWVLQLLYPPFFYFKLSPIVHCLMDSTLLITHCDRKITIGLGGKRMAKTSKQPNLNFIPIFKCCLNLFRKVWGYLFLFSEKFLAGLHYRVSTSTFVLRISHHDLQMERQTMLAGTFQFTLCKFTFVHHCFVCFLLFCH
jgi:hypothetical protein